MAGRYFSRLFGCSANGMGSNDNPITSIEGDQCKKRRHYQREKKLAQHLYGQYSMALVQANSENEDRCQLVSGPLSNVPGGPTGVFVGIYDGHAGDICSQFVLDNLFNDLKTAITDQHINEVNPFTIQQAYLSTEEKFLVHARANWGQNGKLASTGSCCLSGVVHGHTLYVANAGDSRAVLARWGVGDENAEAVQLSIDCNANDAQQRDELRAEHQDDPNLLKLRNGRWLVRDRIEVTRAIGDVYLKFSEFNRFPLQARFRLQHSILRPILKAEPIVEAYQLDEHDKFVIFASNGLWGEVTNEQAVTVVRASPRSGAARALLREALVRASHRHNMQYQQLINLPLDNKRSFHDDISIVILFFDTLPEPVNIPVVELL
ncbi:Phosphatase 2C family protein [Rhynchospora pubera]|uniref:protein-serine/threonine phosphatase n=1 Tax=Rhynchospora pubera TaxID=906938 RepID=A0AAV8ASA4_9POAL|nr:Phosphatase 2C family protein [Rhynchospora pubera]KAJ4786220.1 Phosphatase 2C family protein [Rhynchospora pubera]